jgi:hypothetical protein
MFPPLRPATSRTGSGFTSARSQAIASATTPSICASLANLVEPPPAARLPSHRGGNVPVEFGVTGVRQLLLEIRVPSDL